jgi:hypothetical protein
MKKGFFPTSVALPHADFWNGRLGAKRRAWSGRSLHAVVIPTYISFAI